MSRVLVFGAGYLGRRLSRDLPNAVSSAADIADAPAVKTALAEHRPDVVVNAAGKTGKPNVDWCETHQSETYRSNVIGPLTLADVRRSRRPSRAPGLRVHLLRALPSAGGFREDDFANPISFYSRTKYAADLVLSKLAHVAIARLRMPIDATPHPRNLITKLAGYPVVVDVENSATVVQDLVTAVARMVEVKPSGVFHVVNPGILRHRDLIALYRELVDPGHQAELVPAGDLLKRGLIQAARSNCLLASDRLADIGVQLRPMDVALRDAMEHYAQASE